jgi:hypothetical protein
MYKKWNYRLLRETHQAFMAGRAEKDPTEGWYNGEFGFFDFYIIPLAKKLDKCGIDSTPYVENATNNRKMWEEVGEELVSRFIKEQELSKRSVHSSIEFSLESESSEESSFDSSGFPSFSDKESTDEDEPTIFETLRTPEKAPKAPSIKGRIKVVEKEKEEECSRKFIKTVKGHDMLSPLKQTKNGISPSKKVDKSPKVAGKPIRRIVYSKSKSSPVHNEESNDDKKKSTVENRIGRLKTAVPPGEVRYKQRSKSASSEPMVPVATSDKDNKKSDKSDHKKKKKTRSKSLDNSVHKNTMKGKRPGKANAKSNLE